MSMEVIHQQQSSRLSGSRYDQPLRAPAGTDTMPDMTFDDPMDFFGAIRDLVERGLSVEERSKFGAVESVTFPRVSEVRRDFGADERTAELQRIVESLQRELQESRRELLESTAGAEAAKSDAAAALKRERDELLRVQETLAFERAEFRRYREKAEAQARRLKIEAERVEELESQLEKKNLRLKQKEAEARALAVDGNIVRDLRQDISVKDESLEKLRLEMASMKVAMTAAEERASSLLREQQERERQQQLSKTVEAAAMAPSSSPPEDDPAAAAAAPSVRWAVPRCDVGGAAAAAPSATLTGCGGCGRGAMSEDDMTRTQSMSSVGDDDEALLSAMSAEGVDGETTLDSEGCNREANEEDGTRTEGQGDVTPEGEDGEVVESKKESESDGSAVSDAEGPEQDAVHEDYQVEQDDAESALSIEDYLDGGEGVGVEMMEEDVEESTSETEDESGHDESDDISDVESDELVESSEGLVESDAEQEALCPTPTSEHLESADDGGNVSHVEDIHHQKPESSPSPSDDEDSESMLLRENDGLSAAEEFEGKGPSADAAAAVAVNKLDKKKPRLSLDKGKYAETDEEAAAFAAAKFAAEQAKAYSICDDVGTAGDSVSFIAPAGCSAVVLSLSPIPVGADQSRRRTHMRAPSIAPGGLSPMARLAPADHGLESTGNVVVIELGTWRVRAGVVEYGQGNAGGGEGESRSFFDDFPCCIARPRMEGADLNELVNGASSMAAPMYSKFRETGLFVGGDAWYCCLDHPDSGLRSKLTLSCPLERGRVRLRDGSLASEDTELLLDHAFGLLRQEPTAAPTMVTYKPTATAEEVWEVASILMENQGVPAVRLVNEALLAALAASMTTGVIIDIGESGIYVTPIFDGCPVGDAAQSAPCGGADLTKYLDYMLVSRTNERFNQMVDRRRLEYSRKVKEGHCYVPLDFGEEADRFGSFRRKTMRVFQGAQVSPKLSAYEACNSQEFNHDTNIDDPVTVSFTQKAGTQLDIKIGRERFHTPELLFQPEIWSEMEAQDGLDDLVMEAVSKFDDVLKGQMLADVVLVGGSAAIPGLAERLEQDLMAAVSDHLCEKVRVRALGDDVLRHSNNLSRGSATAVTVGAELLLRSEGHDQSAWIRSSDWEEDSDVLRRHWYIF